MRLLQVHEKFCENAVAERIEQEKYASAPWNRKIRGIAMKDVDLFCRDVFFGLEGDIASGRLHQLLRELDTRDPAVGIARRHQYNPATASSDVDEAPIMAVRRQQFVQPVKYGSRGRQIVNPLINIPAGDGQLTKFSLASRRDGFAAAIKNMRNAFVEPVEKDCTDMCSASQPAFLSNQIAQLTYRPPKLLRKHSDKLSDKLHGQSVTPAVNSPTRWQQRKQR